MKNEIKYKGVWKPQYMAEFLFKRNGMSIQDFELHLKSWAMDIVEVNKVAKQKYSPSDSLRDINLTQEIPGGEVTEEDFRVAVIKAQKAQKEFMSQLHVGNFSLNQYVAEKLFALHLADKARAINAIQKELDYTNKMWELCKGQASLHLEIASKLCLEIEGNEKRLKEKVKQFMIKKFEGMMPAKKEVLDWHSSLDVVDAVEWGMDKEKQMQRLVYLRAISDLDEDLKNF